jgi:hypothetical protein
MSKSKFLRPGSFREIAPPADEDDVDVVIGAIVLLDGERWCIIGIAPNPYRPDERLVFVERVASPKRE